ncbi:phytanoyl-CoA dioxygenase PhyH [Aestuariispira insulae]|uniref:Phytanoyl-CoA dioxygenase PhyH n=2 Tax=Aestuariispira insulae TaxID=1461337 RepID=A0A3D9HHQ3_9PROT|nr:phytanoyl-CoA dioxygenase PhyH [Aestuariispira insulae]
MATVSRNLEEEGYLQLPPVFDNAWVTPLRDGICNLAANGLPPVCIYLYDQPWHLFAALRPLVSRFLGDDYRLLPNFWAWHLSTEAGSRGWPAHRDCQAQTRFPDGLGGHLLMSLSLWVPLTDADEDNGCMHVLPRSVENQYDPPLDDPDRIDYRQGRPLPAKVGSVLGWPQDLFHWSGRATGRSEVPRMSLSLEFQNPAFDPLRTPLLEIDNPPPLEVRLSLIKDQFARYRHMEKTTFDPESLTA